MENSKQGLLIVLSGPSGVGKGTILHRVIGRRKNLKLSRSYTTREPRKGETNGTEYWFLTKEEFLKAAERGEMLEYAEYCGNYYGTPREQVQQELSQGNNVILEIEVQGGEQILKKCPEAIGIFIIPPSVKALEERLKMRGLDSPEAVIERLETSKREFGYAKMYNYMVINDVMDECASNILKIIDAESMKFNHIGYKIEEVLKNA